MNPFNFREPGEFGDGATMLATPSPEEMLFVEIGRELVRARNLFPGPNVTLAALMEEVGELAKATFEEPRANVRREAVQVAVMAMRMVLDGDHTFDAWRAARGLDYLVGPPLGAGAGPLPATRERGA